MSKTNDPIKVLLIEDSPTHAEVIKSQLQESSQEFIVTHCPNWNAAHTRLRKGEQFDDAILDLTLPDVQPDQRGAILDLLARYGLTVTILSGAPKDRNLHQLIKSRGVPFFQKGNADDNNKMIDYLIQQQNQRSDRSAQLSGELRDISSKIARLEVLTERLTIDQEKVEFRIDGGTGGYGIESRLEKLEAKSNHLMELLQGNHEADETFRQEIKSSVLSVAKETRAELAALKMQRDQFDLEAYKGKWAIATGLAIAICTASLPMLFTIAPKMWGMIQHPAIAESKKMPQ